jgi:RHS repeat-associated protein
MIVSSAGVIAQKRAYGPWGDVWYELTPLGSFTQPFSFAGGLYDDAIGYRFGARDYNPWLGRWYSKDRSRFSGGANLYAYCQSDPVNCLDPSGRAGVFYWGAFGAETAGPVRGGVEGIGIAGFDHSAGFYAGDIFASGAAIGGESNYVAAYHGVDVTKEGADSIGIYELGFGPEIPGVAGYGLVLGFYRQNNNEWGYFQGMHGGAIGEHGAVGAGLPLTGEHGIYGFVRNLFCGWFGGSK